MTIQAKTPSISIFQVKPEIKSIEAQIVSPSDFTNPYLHLISPNDGNVVSFEYAFDKKEHFLTVRVVDPNLELFKKFFTSFNYIGRLKDMLMDKDTSFEFIIGQLAQDLEGLNSNFIDGMSQEGKITDDDAYSKSVISIINKQYTRRVREIESEVGSAYTSSKPEALGPQFDEWKRRRQRAIDSRVSDELGSLGFNDLNAAGIQKYMNTYINRRFIAQISDGTHNSLHFDVTLTNMKLFSSSDNLLMVDLVFTVGAQNPNSMGALNSISKSGKFPVGCVGICSVKETNINLGGGTGTKVDTGLLIPDISPKIQSRTITSFIGTTKRRVENIQKSIEAAIGSFLYEFDNTYDISNYLVFLNPELNVKILQLVHEEANFISESSKNHKNSRYYRDKTAAYILALKNVLKRLGFLVIPHKTDDEPTTSYPWKRKTTSYYIKVSQHATYKLEDRKTKQTKVYDTDDPRKFILGLIENMYSTVGVRFVSPKIEPASTWMYKDLLINCLSYNDPNGNFINPLYSGSNNTKNFSLERENLYLLEKGRTFVNRPLIIITDNVADQFLASPMRGDKEAREAIKKLYYNKLSSYYGNINTNSQVIPSTLFAGSNLESLVINGWLEEDVISKFSRLNEIDTKNFETPVFVFNDVGANVINFETVDQNFAFALFKTQPPAFAKRIFFNSVDFLGFDNYDSIKKSFSKVLESSKQVQSNTINQIPNEELTEFGTQLFQYRDDVLTEIVRVGDVYKELYEMIDNVIMTELNTHLESLNKSSASQFIQKRKVFEKATKEVFDQFIDTYSSDKISIFGFLEYLEFFQKMNKFTHVLKIRTTPMFNLSYDNVTNRGCFFKGKVPKSPQHDIPDPFGLGLDNLIFNGAYSITGFKHVASDSDCYSEFTLLKPGITDVVPDTAPEPQTTAAEKQFESSRVNNWGGGRN